MTDKLTPFDVLMYVLPGAALWTMLASVAWLTDPQALDDLPILGEGGLLASVLFLVLCVIGGLVVQALAVWVDQRIRRRAERPWMRGLLGQDDVFSPPERAEMLHGLLNAGLLRPEERDALSADKDVAHLVWDRARHALLDTPAGRRARTAHMYFLLNRGLAMVFGLGALLLAVAWILWLASGILWFLGTVLSLGFWDAPWWFSWHHTGHAAAAVVLYGAATALLTSRSLATDRHRARLVLLGAARSHPA